MNVLPPIFFLIEFLEQKVSNCQSLHCKWKVILEQVFNSIHIDFYHDVRYRKLIKFHGICACIDILYLSENWITIESFLLLSSNFYWKLIEEQKFFIRLIPNRNRMHCVYQYGTDGI